MSLVVLLSACPSDGDGTSSSSSSTGGSESSTAATIDPTPATLDTSATVADTSSATTTVDTSATESSTATTGDTSSDSTSITTDDTSSESSASTTSTDGTSSSGEESTSGGPSCGDGVLDGDEACDGEDLGGLACTDLGMGFVGGTLACDDACNFDTSACTDEDPVAYDIGFCRLQFPDAIETTVGAQIDVFGRVYIAGLTDLSDVNDLAPTVGGWVGYGPDGSDPQIDAGWTWTAGVPNGGYGPASPGAEANNDEYQAVLTAPAAGSYDFAFRFSGDGGMTFTYCDGQPAGNSDGYQPANAGQLTVEA